MGENSFFDFENCIFSFIILGTLKTLVRDRDGGPSTLAHASAQPVRCMRGASHVWNSKHCGSWCEGKRFCPRRPSWIPYCQSLLIAAMLPQRWSWQCGWLRYLCLGKSKPSTNLIAAAAPVINSDASVPRLRCSYQIYLLWIIKSQRRPCGIRAAHH